VGFDGFNKFRTFIKIMNIVFVSWPLPTV